MAKILFSFFSPREVSYPRFILWILYSLVGGVFLAGFVISILNGDLAPSFTALFFFLVLFAFAADYNKMLRSYYRS